MNLDSAATDVGLVAQCIPARVRSLEIEATFMALAAARRHLDHVERLAFEHWKDSGLSWSDVAEPMGIPRQNAHRRYRLLSGK